MSILFQPWFLICFAVAAFFLFLGIGRTSKSK